MFVRSTHVLRWLLPVIAAFALVASSVSAWAAAGVIGDTSCCCPAPERCDCDDHDDDAPVLKRCSTDATLVTPAITPAIPPARIDASPVISVTAASHAPPRALPASPTYEPETPPF